MQFELDDGTGRPPRNKEQADFLAWVSKNWGAEVSHIPQKQTTVLAGQLPTGVGKSWLATAIQRQTGAAIIVPSNLLMDDTYTSTYPWVNALKGKTHYTCNTMPEFSCSEYAELLNKEPCPACPYALARRAAIRGEPTFYNPMSLFYAQKIPYFKRPGVIVVDEAHQLRDMLLLISGKTFRRGKYKFPDTVNETDIIAWLKRQLVMVSTLFIRALEEGDADKIKELSKEIDSLSNTVAGLDENPQNYCIHISDGLYRGKPEKYLNVVPLEPPRFLVKELLNCDKLILISATLSRMDVETLIGNKPYSYIDMPSPIPVASRTVHYKPMKFLVNYKTDPALIVGWVETILKEPAHKGLNTIIHASYSLAKKLAPFFTVPIITHDVDTKQMALERFKTEGGVFLASGFAEGVDLKDDLCRLNIIPVISKMNTFDPAVKKRMAWRDGQRWYALEQIKTLVQQAGRSTRGEKDYSKIIVGDPALPRLILHNKLDVPKSFDLAINWRGK